MKKTRVRRIASMTLVTWTLFLVFFIIYCILTNPFNSFSIVPQFYTTTVQGTTITLAENIKPRLVDNKLALNIAFAKSGYHILSYSLRGSPPAPGTDALSIADAIYTDRFSDTAPFLISGEHFSLLYPRNLGTFYIPLLDTRLVSDREQWEDRQKILLRTTAFALEVFAQKKEPCTTIATLGGAYVTCIPIYAYPSDALYSLLFSLDVMREPQALHDLYPMNATASMQLKTQQAATNLLNDYKPHLRQLLDQYRDTVYDESTGLVRRGIHLSGMKDITRRDGAFFDNVIFWKTVQLAEKLGIKKTEPGFLEEYKERILTTFWDEKRGIFLEDMSESAQRNGYYSSDWLVVYFTGFLSPDVPEERRYYERSIEYIRTEKLDEPFGLPYHSADRAERQVSIVRFAVPEYGGSAIWSFWGTEYAKLLIRMGTATNDYQYIIHARKQLDAYKNNIITYGGFPEVYSPGGSMLHKPLYRSIRQTGWIINYEQAEQLYDDLTYQEPL